LYKEIVFPNFEIIFSIKKIGHPLKLLKSINQLLLFIQYAQHVLARNHSGPMSLKSRKCRRIFLKSRCWHREMSEKNRTRCFWWFTIKRRLNTDIDD